MRLHWLVKSEPSTHGLETVVKTKKTTWDGVKNYSIKEKRVSLAYYMKKE